VREEFKRLPKVLKKNIIFRIGLGLAVLTVFILICIFADHLVLALAPGAFAMFLLMDGVGMMFRCLGGDYVELSGICIEVKKSTIRRKTKHIVIETTRGKVKLPTRIKPNAVKEGDKVTIYVPDHASVYDYNGDMVVCEFYGIQIID
jgi:hypothetical protein